MEDLCRTTRVEEALQLVCFTVMLWSGTPYSIRARARAYFTVLVATTFLRPVGI